jgi:hypothetical protein
MYIGNYLKSPMYDVDFWSVYNRIVNNIPKTTNSIEAWHHGLITWLTQHILI